jgi:hypothetical protein
MVKKKVMVELDSLMILLLSNPVQLLLDVIPSYQGRHIISLSQIVRWFMHIE